MVAHSINGASCLGTLIVGISDTTWIMVQVAYRQCKVPLMGDLVIVKDQLILSICKWALGQVVKTQCRSWWFNVSRYCANKYHWMYVAFNYVLYSSTQNSLWTAWLNIGWKQCFFNRGRYVELVKIFISALWK